MRRRNVRAAWVAALIVGSSVAHAEPGAKTGEQVYALHCARCHGAQADGDSAIARVISPKPPSLRASTLAVPQMREIVSRGGERVGRSPIMPRWEDQLTATDIEAVVGYVNGLRETYHASNSAKKSP